MIIHQLVGMVVDLQLQGPAAEAVVVNAIAIERLVAVQMVDASEQAHPKPVVEILDSLDRIVFAEQLARAAPVEKAGADKIVHVLAERPPFGKMNLRIVGRAAILGSEFRIRQRPARRVDGRVIGVDHRRLGMGFQKLDQAQQLIGMHGVVGRSPRPEFSPGELEPVAQRFRQPLIGLRQHPHSRITHILRQYPFRPVG